MTSPAVTRAGGLVPEWAPQSAVLLTWPHEDTDWEPDLERVEACFAAIVREVTRREIALVVCASPRHAHRVRSAIAAAGGDVGRVRCHAVPSNDTWARDHGPLTVSRDGRPVLLDFRFNGWGGKFPAHLDDRITGTLHAEGAFGRTPLESVDLVLEGGAIDTDGEGTLLTTPCLLTPTRNPGLSRAALEARLRAILGVSRVCWLEHGRLAGDDTDGHVDTLARFCDPGTIAYQSCEDAGDEHHGPLAAMREELAALRRSDGRPYRLVALPWPRPVRDDDGRRLPAGYANFLVINGAVLVPVYDDVADDTALEALAGCFPGRDVVGIDCRVLIRQSGSLHCVAMQLPAGVVPARTA